MSSVIDGVDQRTQLAGTNRLELLLFRLGGKQLYGINVFKVKEAIPLPPLTQIPNSHPVILGAADIRGQTVSIYDLSKGIGLHSLHHDKDAFIILTEYNRSVQGFLVRSVERIVNISWSDILPMPPGLGKTNYMTAVTHLDDEMVQVIDVEQVLAEVLGIKTEVSSNLARKLAQSNADEQIHILVADDSGVAGRQIRRTMEQINIDCMLVNDGQQALDQLKKWAAEGINVPEYLAMLISDIEMPEMDGYTLTTEIRKDPRLKDLKVLLHTSMSGTFNTGLAEKVGADRFIPKFSADELASEVQDIVEQWRKTKKTPD